MTELINALFEILAASDYAQYGTTLLLVGYTLAHIIPYLPVTWTAKIPDIVMTVLNILSAKHGAAKAAKTNIAGNPVDE